MIEQEMTGKIAFSLTGVRDDLAEGEMPVTAGILNPFGTIHAGALVWFADVIATNLVLGGLSVSTGMESFPVAVTLNAQLLGNVKEGKVSARAEWVKRGRRVSTVRTQVRDQSDRVLLDLTSTHVSAK